MVKWQHSRSEHKMAQHFQEEIHQTYEMCLKVYLTE